MEAQILQVGRTSIPYQVRFSDQARRKRIVVTPGQVEVVAPAGTPWEGPRGIAAFVEAKRAWVFNAVEDCRKFGGETMPQRYESGAKLLYRGRWLMLKIKTAPVEEVQIECRSRFMLRLRNASPSLSAPKQLPSRSRIGSASAPSKTCADLPRGTPENSP